MRFVFGYGSLIWKPPPHTISRKPGFIRGFARRFAQSSHDHRGTEEAPGIVVTLIPAHEWHQYAEQPDDDIVWGVMYEIEPDFGEYVREYLDEREQDGYTLTSVDVWNTKSSSVTEAALVQKDVSLYVGHSDNSSFLGAIDMNELAETISKSSGPSGSNAGYLFQLSQAVKELNPCSEDRHLQSLEKKVRNLQRKADTPHTNGNTS